MSVKPSPQAGCVIITMIGWMKQFKADRSKGDLQL